MRSRACLAAAFLVLPALGAQYRTALPGYRYEFPRDHFSHPDFQTEWWYYTGNLQSADGHHFGFELTFFRQALDRNPAKTAAWDVRDLYSAHLALSDLDGHQFYHAERTNRVGPGLAGVSASDGRIWNGNWQIRWRGGQQQLQAVDDRFELDFTLRSEKPPVIHGENGISQKAEGPGHASHYISLTRLTTAGRVELAGKKFDVSGLAWMDHEFFTHQLARDQGGWDWLSLQLDDNRELMLFRIRRRDGSIDPYSAGTLVDAQGNSTHLRAIDFILVPLSGSWISPLTRAVYPIHWRISIPRLGVELEAQTRLAPQELTSNSRLVPSYWEGAVTVTGHEVRSPLAGVGYLELTGYDRPLPMGN